MEARTINPKNKTDKSFPEHHSALLNQQNGIRETGFAHKNRYNTDEEIIAYLREVAKELGKVPAKHEVKDSALIKRRFGPWNRALEKAGLKEISPRHIAKVEKRMVLGGQAGKEQGTGKSEKDNKVTE